MRSCDTKRRSQFSSLPASDYYHQSKRSELIKTDINDLPDGSLLEILYRLDCYKFVAQCKCVSKRWCNLMSNPSFIRNFLSLKSDKHSPIKHSLLDFSGVEFLGRLSSSTKPLTPLFERLMRFCGLKRKPVIRGSYNDLILCSASSCCQCDYYICNCSQCDYYICNPSTVQWVRLPPPPQVYNHTPVGFICDLPYYNRRSTGNQGGSIIHLNVEYRCRVVRLICPEDQRNTVSKEFKVQIFSSETNEWIETIVSSPSPFYFDVIDHHTSYANKGMLYWGSLGVDDEKFLIGLNPFTINSSNNTSLSITSSSSTNGGDIIEQSSNKTSLSSTTSSRTNGGDIVDHSSNKTSLSSTTSSRTDGGDIIDHNNCCFIALGQDEDLQFSPLGVYKGCMRIFEYDIETRTLFVVDLNDEAIHEKVCLDEMRVYRLNEEMIPNDDTVVSIKGFDPDNDDILYLERDDINCGERDILKCNIRTGTWSMVAKKTGVTGGLYPLAVPWWPTPVPKVAPD